ncbi:hypothetical protein [Microlunatus soli]|uniref:Uncharacterized protein n=1 Tax=Microlunatus soli TaxID=630515 RepID=A0A1H1VUJ4_9ACTN|nr:hypothetical protein [Microlunatus soli]SDS88131.1 hypothetical protein SAMN04489812_3347 [Microlunatus soli]
MRTSLLPLFSEQDITALLSRALSAAEVEPAVVGSVPGGRTGSDQTAPGGVSDAAGDLGDGSPGGPDAWDEADRSW